MDVKSKQKTPLFARQCSPTPSPTYPYMFWFVVNFMYKVTALCYFLFYCVIWFISILRSAHTMGLVPVTSRMDPSHRVNWPFLQQNLVAGTKIWSLRLVPRIQTGLNWWDWSQGLKLVPATRFWGKNGQFTRCDWSLRLVTGTSCQFTRCDWSLRLVAGTSRIVCADL